MVSSPWLWRVVFYVAIDDWNTLCNDVTWWDLTLPHSCANQSQQAALSPLQMGSWRVGTWRSNFREPKVALLLAQKSIRRHLGDFLKRKPAPWMLTCGKQKRWHQTNTQIQEHQLPPPNNRTHVAIWQQTSVYNRKTGQFILLETSVLFGKCQLWIVPWWCFSKMCGWEGQLRRALGYFERTWAAD